ncbi:Formamidase [subsurface metagenome]
MGLKKYLYNTSKADTCLNIASVSMICDENPEKNLIKMTNTIEDIKANHSHVELIVFGETIHGWFFNHDKTAEYHHNIAETISGKTTQLMSELAIKNNVYICFGINEKEENRFYNSQVLVDTKGDVTAVHRKTKMREKFFTPGEVLVTIAKIKELKTGIVICYDVQAKEVNKALRKSNLDLIIHSLADDEDPREFGIGYLARSYYAWIVNANRYGEEGGHYWNGWITVTNPMGEICAKGKEKEQYLYYEIGIVKQNYIKRSFRKMYVRTARVVHVIKNIDMALATVFDRSKVKKSNNR